MFIPTYLTAYNLNTKLIYIQHVIISIFKTWYSTTKEYITITNTSRYYYDKICHDYISSNIYRMDKILCIFNIRLSHSCNIYTGLASSPHLYTLFNIEIWDANSYMRSIHSVFFARIIYIQKHGQNLILHMINQHLYFTPSLRILFCKSQ